MSGALQRLGRHALGEGPSLRPRLPSRFESAEDVPALVIESAEDAAERRPAADPPLASSPPDNPDRSRESPRSRQQPETRPPDAMEPSTASGERPKSEPPATATPEPFTPKSASDRSTPQPHEATTPPPTPRRAPDAADTFGQPPSTDDPTPEREVLREKETVRESTAQPPVQPIPSPKTDRETRMDRRFDALEARLREAATNARAPEIPAARPTRSVTPPPTQPDASHHPAAPGAPAPINIQIGSIIVRAHLPQAPAAPKAAHTANADKFQDYLARRTAGRF